MSDKLREEIEQHLDLCKRVGHDSKGTKLLQRVLTELDKGRWNSVEVPPPESGDYLCRMMDVRDGSDEQWFEVVHYTKKEAFPSVWNTVDFDAVLEWKPIY